MDEIEKMFPPELKTTMTELSEKFSEAYSNGGNEGLGSMLEAAQKVMRDEPEILQKSLATLSKSGLNLEGSGVNMPAVLQQVMQTFGFGGLGGDTSSQGEEKEQKTIKDYEERDVLLPATAEQIEQEKKMKFRVRLDREKDEKTKLEVQLEKGINAYQIWHFEEGKKYLIRIAIQEMIREEKEEKEEKEKK